MAKLFFIALLLLSLMSPLAAHCALEQRSCSSSSSNEVFISPKSSPPATSAFTDGIEVNLTTNCSVLIEDISASFIRFVSSSLLVKGPTITIKNVQFSQQSYGGTSPNERGAIILHSLSGAVALLHVVSVTATLEGISADSSSVLGLVLIRGIYGNTNGTTSVTTVKIESSSLTVKPSEATSTSSGKCTAGLLVFTSDSSSNSNTTTAASSTAPTPIKIDSLIMTRKNRDSTEPINKLTVTTGFPCRAAVVVVAKRVSLVVSNRISAISVNVSAVAGGAGTAVSLLSIGDDGAEIKPPWRLVSGSPAVFSFYNVSLVLTAPASRPTSAFWRSSGAKTPLVSFFALCDKCGDSARTASPTVGGPCILRASFISAVVPHPVLDLNLPVEKEHHEQQQNERRLVNLIEADNSSFPANTATAAAAATQVIFHFHNVLAASSATTTASSSDNVFNNNDFASSFFSSTPTPLDGSRTPTLICVLRSPYVCPLLPAARVTVNSTEKSRYTLVPLSDVSSGQACSTNLDASSLPTHFASECALPTPPENTDFVTDLSRAAAAFFSLAIASASVMSVVAFGLSRSQEVGEFVTAAGTGVCFSANFTQRPIFSDSPLGIHLDGTWCAYSGGAVVGNIVLSAIAIGASLFFGLLGCVLRGRRPTVHRVMTKGWFGVVASNVVGLFLTPTIQHSSLCALRERGSTAGAGVRALMGIIAIVLFVGAPLWAFWPLKRGRIYYHGKLKERNEEAPSCCQRTVGAAWLSLFGQREWVFVPRRELSEEMREKLAVIKRSGAKFLSEKEQQHQFLAWRPLFDEYDDRVGNPDFFFVEVFINAALGPIPVITEAFVGAPPQAACWAWGVPLALVLLVYFALLAWKRPIQVKIMLLTTITVGGLQLVMTIIGLIMIGSGGQTRLDWSSSIDIALVVSQALMCTIGILLAIKSVMSGGWRKIKNCLCPTKDDEQAGSKEDPESGGDDDENNNEDDNAAELLESHANTNGNGNNEYGKGDFDFEPPPGPVELPGAPGLIGNSNNKNNDDKNSDLSLDLGEPAPLSPSAAAAAVSAEDNALL